MKQESDRESVFKLIQDMMVSLRDMDDFTKSIQYKYVISQFQKGFEEEYSQA